MQSTLLSGSSSGSSPAPPPGALDKHGRRISGATERQTLLLCANVLLLLLGAAMVIVSVVLLAAFLLGRLGFVSALFPAAPLLLICAGCATALAAAVGLFLWRQRRRERSAGFRLLAALLVLSCLLCLAASVMAFLLRETIAHTFGSTRVSAQLSRYDDDAAVRARWDSLQRTFGCCGGGEAGYFDYADVRGDISKVPDSCCQTESPGCGSSPFEQAVPVPPLSEQLYPEGCMLVIRRSLDRHVLPALLALALVALVAALIQLLLVLAVCCFADHVKRIKDRRRSTMSLDRGTLSGGDQHSSLPSKQPWHRLDDDGGGGGGVRMSVPVLESSPSTLKRSANYQRGGGGGGTYSPSPAPSLIVSPAPPGSKAAANDDALSSVSFVSASTAAGGRQQHAGDAGNQGPTASKKKHSSWLSWANVFGGSGKGEPNGDLPPARKEALREEAHDREETLMNVLRNVNSPPDVEAGGGAETAEAAKGEVTAKGEGKKAGFSFFGIKSKSRDHVLRSSDSKLDNGSDGGEGGFKKKRSKAQSLEALNQKQQEGSGGGGGGKSGRWGSGIWSWWTRSRERVDSGSGRRDGDVEEDLSDEKTESVVRIEGGAAPQLKASPADSAAVASDSEVQRGKARSPKISFDLGDGKHAASASTGDLQVAREEERRQEKAASVDAGLAADKDDAADAGVDEGGNKKASWFSRWAKRDSSRAIKEANKDEQKLQDGSKDGYVSGQYMSSAALETDFGVDEQKINFSMAQQEQGERHHDSDNDGEVKKLKAPLWARASSKERQQQEVNLTMHDTKGDNTKEAESFDAEKKEKQDREPVSLMSINDPEIVGNMEAATNYNKLKAPKWSRPSSKERDLTLEKHVELAPSAESRSPQRQEASVFHDEINKNDELVSRRLKAPSWSRPQSNERQSRQESLSPSREPRVPSPPTIDRRTKPKKKKKSSHQKRDDDDDHQIRITEQQAIAISQLEAVLDGDGSDHEEEEHGPPRRLVAPVWIRSTSPPANLGHHRKDEYSDSDKEKHDEVKITKRKKSKQRSKSASEEPVKSRMNRARERPPEPAVAPHHYNASSSSRSLDREKFRRISEMTDPATVQHHKSETDLRGSGRLPSRKPTTIGSSEDILAFREEEEEKRRKESATPFKLKLPAFARALSPGGKERKSSPAIGGPTSLPHSLTTPKEEEKARRAAGLAARTSTASPPPRPLSPSQQGNQADVNNESFHQVRIAGFGVERLQPKMKASPKMKHAGLQTDPDADDEKKGDIIVARGASINSKKRMPKSREVRKEDEARILLIEQEIEGVSRETTPSRSSKGSGGATGSSKRKKSSKGTSTDELVVIPKKKSTAEQSKMLARRLGDHNFMQFIKKSSLYGDYKKASKGRVDDSATKWKGDKIDKAIETASSEESGDVGRLVRGRRGRTASDSSRSSSEGGGARARGHRARQQYYLSRADGTILYAFESGSPEAQRARGRSYDELKSITLPFGPTEHFDLQPDLTFLNPTDDSHRSTRAKSEPRSVQKSRRRTAAAASSSNTDGGDRDDRAKSVERVLVRRKKASAPVGPHEAWEILQNMREQEDRHLYRTTLEVQSVGSGNFDIRGPSTSGGRGSAERQLEKPSRKHVSVTTMHIRGGRGADDHV